MKLAILMDDLTVIKPLKDSTVAMIKSAETLGWSCVYFTLNDLFCRNGHLRTDEDTYVRPDGERECRICRKIARQ